MLNQKLLESLPSAPEDAFAIFEAQLRQEVPIREDFQDYNEQREHDADRERKIKEYILAIGAFVELYEIDVGVSFEALLDERGDSFLRAFEEASTKIIFFSNKCAIKNAQSIKRGTSCIYVLDEASKIKIRKQLDKIREIITEADLTDNKKDALFRKLNAFALEIDRDRTRMEAFAAMYVSVKAEASEIVELAENIEKVWKTVAKGGKELWKSLPNIKINGHLSAPPKKLEDHTEVSLDDEIPF